MRVGVSVCVRERARARACVFAIFLITCVPGPSPSCLHHPCHHASLSTAAVEVHCSCENRIDVIFCPVFFIVQPSQHLVVHVCSYHRHQLLVFYIVLVPVRLCPLVNVEKPSTSPVFLDDAFQYVLTVCACPTQFG